MFNCLVVCATNLESSIAAIKDLGGTVFRVFCVGAYFFIIVLTIMEILKHVKDRDFMGTFKALLAGAGAYGAVKLTKTVFDIIDDTF